MSGVEDVLMKNKKMPLGRGIKNGMMFFGECHKDTNKSDTNKNFLSVLKNLKPLLKMSDIRCFCF